MKYSYKTQPYAHQRSILNRSAKAPYFGLFCEQGTGKTKITIDNGSWLWGEGHLRSLVILAPSGVHTNWVRNELPAHCPVRYDAAVWNSELKKPTRRALDTLSEDNGNFKVLAMNIEAIRQEKGFDFVVAFMKKFAPCMLVIDESTIIKNPKALQTKAAFKLANLAKYRRILTGTPVTQGPLDVWAQCRFLSPTALPFATFTAFRDRYAVVQNVCFGGRSFKKIESYKNLEELQELLKGFTVRVMKEDCLDLPEKIYQRTYVELDSAQRKAYNEMLELSFTELATLEASGKVVHANNVISALMKVQQIVSGFLKDNDGNIHDISDTKLCALEQVILRRFEEDPKHKFIIWSVFTHDVRRISGFLSERFKGLPVFEYYGETSSEDRMDNVGSFQSLTEPGFFVANAAGARGLTLTNAGTAIYYSNGPSLETRLQSEDRNHRIGQTQRPLYVDIVAQDTVDEKILLSLKEKKTLSALVVGWRSLLSV